MIKPLQRRPDLHFHLVPHDDQDVPDRRSICGIQCDTSSIGQPDSPHGWFTRYGWFTLDDPTFLVARGMICRRCLKVVTTLYRESL